MTTSREFALAGATTRLAVLLVMSSLALAGAFALKPPADVVLDGAMRQQTIDALAVELHRHYVFPDKARQIETLLRQRLRDGKYDAIANGMQFAAQLSADMAAVAHDLHMKVRFSPEVLRPGREPNVAANAAANAAPVRNGGVEEVRRLGPAIGYLRISAFPPPSLVAARYASALNALADTDALVIDVRDNRGGSPQSVALLISYFVDRRTRLNDIWSRDSGQTLQFWTEDRLDGKRYGGKKPVMILAGPRTASAGEDFTYTMQALQRATVVGARTWGGAHPVAPYRLGDHFYAAIPNSRSISPITHTNWEGTGVAPDVAVAPAEALEVALDRLRRQRDAGLARRGAN
ncbi:S41 family peptidase [uncultured Massilia sp.]|uniref:S41 family peptidase n=1 Tax=uncultured Massilia sp. TaxID=169973 RepID=UPI0025F2F657|nr:S41 family peptidase [uncultured Massilia sp.]